MKLHMSRLGAVVLVLSIISVVSPPTLQTLAISPRSVSGSTAGSEAFSSTGADQTWTVPSGVTEVQVYVRGAAGGSDVYNHGAGGKGAYVSAVLNVTPGDTLTIVAGSKGGSGAGGMNVAVYGGGGTYSANVTFTASGGGASDIRIGGSTLDKRVVVAGGGGGSGANSTTPGGNAGTPSPGGNG
jgi:hypothetical protein